MRSTKHQLQQLMNEIMLLEKDQDRIYGKIVKRATAGGQESTVVSDTRGEEERRVKRLNPQELNTTYSHRDADKQRVANEKELKRIWAEEVKAEGSRSFFDQTLTKVHWVGGYTGAGESANPFNAALRFIKSQPKGRIRDEISCFGYAPSQGIDHKPTSVGVIIKGYTTYVSAVDAATHMTSRATDVERRKHSGSGLHKRPLMSLPTLAAQNMIVDEESWSSATRQYHEVIVDNWVVSGIIIPSFQQMIDEFKRNISGIGRERQGMVDKKVEEAKRNFQELGRVASETGIPFYDDKLQPFDFSGKEFEAGELESEWDKVISPIGDKVEGFATGDPDVPEIVVEDKEIYLTTNGFSKSITLKNCDIKQLELNNLKGGKVSLVNCDRTLVGAQFESGEGSIELINPKRNNADVIALNSNFKLKSAKFVGCNFGYKLAGKLQEQREKNGSIITFENCNGLPYDAMSWSRPASVLPPPPPQPPLPPPPPPRLPPPPPVFFYHGPGKPGVTQIPANIIADFIRADRTGDHKIHVNGNWVDAAQSLRVSESRLQRLVREELLNEDVRRRDGKWCAYVDDKLTKAEKEANPKRHKGKKVGAVQRTPDGKIRMKARACYASKKKANNAMAAAMMEGTEGVSLDQLLEEIAEVEALLEGRKPPPGTLWKNIRNRRKAGKRRLRPGEKGYPKTLDFEK